MHTKDIWMKEITSSLLDVQNSPGVDDIRVHKSVQPTLFFPVPYDVGWAELYHAV